jgi:hypothetical protein
MSDDDREQWWLAAQVRPVAPGQTLAIDVIRQIDATELVEIKNANDLLTGLASASPYAKLFEIATKLNEAARPSSKSVKRRVIEMNKAARSLASAAKKFPNEVRQQVERDFEEKSEQLQLFEQAVLEECSSSAYRILVAVGDVTAGPFQEYDQHVAIDPTTMAHIQNIHPFLPTFNSFPCSIPVLWHPNVSSVGRSGSMPENI